MREFSTQITQALVNGLRPDEVLRDDAFLRDMYNIMPFERGPKPYESISNAIEDLDYPFPQWFRFESEDILVTRTAVYRLNTDYMPFELESFVTENFEYTEFTEPFHAVDYGDNWLLINSGGCIYKYNGVVKSSTALRAHTAIKHKNRTLIAGAVDGLWTEKWASKLNMIREKAAINVDQFTFDFSGNVVFWSDFDSIYFPFSFLEDGFVDTTSFVELLYSNQFGYIPARTQGDVLAMFSALEQVFCFSETSVFSLTMNPQATGASFTETGFQPISIRCRQAVGGDDDSVVFIDDKNHLWKINNQGILKLGYSRYMEELSDNMVISKDYEEEIFYIGDDSRSFALVDNRLTRINQTVQSTYSGFASEVGIVHQTGSDKAVIETDKVDIGIPGLKTLTGIHIASDTQLSGNAQATAFVRGKEVKGKKNALNQEGYASVRLFGTNHSVRVEIDNKDDANIDVIELKWQLDDNRQRRGIFATQGATGTGE